MGHSAFQFSQLLADFPLKIDSLTSWGSDKLVAGCSEGALIILGPEPGKSAPVGGTPPYGCKYVALDSRKSAAKRAIRQVLVAPELDLLFVLSENDGVSVCKLPSLDPFAQLAPTKGCSVFAWDSTRRVLAAGIKRRLLLLELTDGDRFILTKELGVPEVPVAMEWCAECLMLGLKKEYLLMDSRTGAITELFATGRSGAPLILKLSEGELLLGKGNSGIFTGVDGKPTRKSSLRWSDTPLAVLACPPYALALLPRFVEIRLVEPPYALTQAVPVQDMQLLQGHGGQHAVVASRSTVYLLRQLPFLDQARDLGRYLEFEAALDLCALAMARDDMGPDQSKETASALHAHYGYRLLSHGEFSKGLRHLQDSHALTTPQLLSLFPPLYELALRYGAQPQLPLPPLEPPGGHPTELASPGHEWDPGSSHGGHGSESEGYGSGYDPDGMGGDVEGTHGFGPAVASVACPLDILAGDSGGAGLPLDDGHELAESPFVALMALLQELRAQLRADASRKQQEAMTGHVATGRDGAHTPLMALSREGTPRSGGLMGTPRAPGAGRGVAAASISEEEPGPADTDNERMQELVDTAVLKALLASEALPQQVTDFLLAAPAVDVAEAEADLRRLRRFPELVLLYRLVGRHADALNLLASLAEGHPVELSVAKVTSVPEDTHEEGGGEARASRHISAAAAAAVAAQRASRASMAADLTDPSALVDYLQGISATHADLVLRFLRGCLLPRFPSHALDLLKGIPPDAITPVTLLGIIKKNAPQLCLPYLWHVLVDYQPSPAPAVPHNQQHLGPPPQRQPVLGDPSSGIPHSSVGDQLSDTDDSTDGVAMTMADELVQLLLNAVLEERRQGAWPPHAEPMTPTRQQLLTFLGQSTAYLPERYLCRLPANSLHEERAALLARVGLHEQVLHIYVRKLGDPRRAESYCERVFQRYCEATAAHQGGGHVLLGGMGPFGVGFGQPARPREAGPAPEPFSSPLSPVARGGGSSRGPGAGQGAGGGDWPLPGQSLDALDADYAASGGDYARDVYLSLLKVLLVPGWQGDAVIPWDSAGALTAAAITAGGGRSISGDVAAGIDSEGDRGGSGADVASRDGAGSKESQRGQTQGDAPSSTRQPGVGVDWERDVLLEDAAELLRRHPNHIDTLRALEQLPGTAPLHELLPFLHSILRGKSEARRNLAIVKSLHASEHFRTRDALQSCRRRRVLLETDRTCTGCLKVGCLEKMLHQIVWLKYLPRQ
eukprot:jgi/Mesvir1/10495/Mv15048-RA.1